MNEYIITLIWGIILFIIIFVYNYFLIFKINNKKKKKKKELKELIGLSYLIPKFNLDIKKINYKYVTILISSINALIISVVFMIVYLIPWNTGFSMLLGFVLLFCLIYSLYEILGRHLVKKGWSKNV